MSDHVPLDEALTVAEAIAHVLSPACTRIEIAGSIRRRVATVKDIEIVCVPRVARDLFGDVDEERPTDLDLLVDELVRAGRLAPRLSSVGIAAMGRRMKRLTAVKSGIALDLFAVLPPAQFGAIMAIRTGPAEYSKRLVTECQRHGLRCDGGSLYDTRDGAVVQTPEERDFIEACGVPYVEPWERG